MRILSVLWGAAAFTAGLAVLVYLVFGGKALRRRQVKHFLYLMKLFLSLLVMVIAAVMYVWSSL